MDGTGARTAPGAGAPPQTSPPVGAPAQETELDAAVATVRAAAPVWAKMPVEAKAALLARMIRDTADAAGDWVDAAAAAKRLRPDEQAAAEEWLAGPWLLIRMLRLLQRSLLDVAETGTPHLPGKPRTGPTGKLRVPVFPTDLWDRLLWPRMTAEVEMQPGVTPDTMQVPAYGHMLRGREAGGVTLVLGAGNVASIAPKDALYELFVEDRTVVLKTNPVNAYLRPYHEHCLAAVIEPGFLRLVGGGVAEGTYLCSHPGVDSVHITGSDRSYEGIVFGAGPEGQARKRRNEPLLTKPVTAELGNLSPVVVIPGPWSESDLTYQGENIASMLVNNAGFNCVTVRVLITHVSWPQREDLLARVRSELRRVPSRDPYYPGARDRFLAFTGEHPEAWTAQGTAQDASGVPWTMVTGVDPQVADDICFTTEAFCGLFAETALPAADPAAFVDEAVRFCNEQVWGTLGATILVHPATMKDPRVAGAVERAVSDLRYGTVSVNGWHAVGYSMTSPPWGGYPGATPADIQSGVGASGNTYMLADWEKTVIRGPWRMRPKPVYFSSSRTSLQTARLLTEFEADPSVRRLPRLFASALRN